VHAINSKQLVSHEPHVAEMLAAATRLRATTSVAEAATAARMLFIFVQTPSSGGDRHYDHAQSNGRAAHGLCNHAHRQQVRARRARPEGGAEVAAAAKRSRRGGDTPMTAPCAASHSRSKFDDVGTGTGVRGGYGVTTCGELRRTHRGDER
jgi:hypothetical protein